MIGCLSIQIVQRHLFLCPLPLFVCIGLVQDQYAHNHIIVNWSGDARLTSTKHCSLRDTRHIQSNLPATGKAGPHRPPVMLWSRTWCRRRLMLGTNLTVNIWRLRFSLRFSRLPGSVCGWTDVDLQTQEVVGPFCSKCEDVMSLAWFILYAVLSNCCRCNINTVSHVLNSLLTYYDSQSFKKISTVAQMSNSSHKAQQQLKVKFGIFFNLDPHSRKQNQSKGLM